ncbi:MAG: DUF4886 domain-containing protein [Eubacteriales bacterium]|nr:DUF4886 domain-containing protein [Eubacteriales bacterium]
MKKFAVFLICILLLEGISPQVSYASAGNFAQQTTAQRPAAGKTTRILLVGNSFTLFNHLDELLTNLSQSAGRKVKVTTVAQGGASLEQYASLITPEGKILHRLLADQKWDYVILQDRHFYPIVHPDKLKNSVLALKPYIKRSGARLALYMTWAPGKGHQEYTTFRHLVSGKRDFQLKVGKVYKDAGKAANALVIPVGYAFYREQSNSGVRLLRQDKYHPNYAGSYLAACTIYSAIFKESPNSSFYGELRGSTARHLQRLAYRTVQKNSI